LPSSSNPLTFQQLVLRLQCFWADHGCVLQQPYDVEVGAGTMAPETFLRVLGPKPYHVGYVQPSRRPADGRYGENPNRLFKHMQFQVILKPPPANVQDLYLESLQAIGIDLRKHDIKFEEDNWESPTLGAWGIGWQVMLDGLEITQFTYFQQCGGIDLDPISVELTYGLERIAAFLQDVDSIYDITWVVDPDGRPVKYGEIRFQDERQFSVYNFEAADLTETWRHFSAYEHECEDLLDVYVEADARLGYVIARRSQVVLREGSAYRVIPAQEILFEAGLSKIYYAFDPTTFDCEFSAEPMAAQSANKKIGEITVGGPFATQVLLLPNPAPLVLPAFDLCLKCSHLFNILDARGAISVTERVGVIARIRALAVGVAKAYVEQQKAEAELSSILSPKEGDKDGAPVLIANG
jgi:glycyl-tRNA synthetase alpha chain